MVNISIVIQMFRHAYAIVIVMVLAFFSIAIDSKVLCISLSCLDSARCRS